MKITTLNTKLYQKTLEWLLARPRSVAETRTYLHRRNSEKDSEQIINQLISQGYLDDTAFAKLYVENRRISRGISQRRLELELRKKGVASQIISRAIAENPRNDYEEIRKIITKKAPKYQNDPQKLIQYLAAQGFDYESAKTAVHEMDSRNSA